MSIISKEKIEKLSIEEIEACIKDTKKQMEFRKGEPYVHIHGLGDGFNLLEEALKICEEVLKEKQMPMTARTKFNDRNFLLAIDRVEDDLLKLVSFMVKIINGQVEPTKAIIKPLKIFTKELQYCAKEFPSRIEQIKQIIKKLK